jgi:uncharacterized protein
MPNLTPQYKKLWLEFVTLLIIIPMIMYFYGSRSSIYFFLWAFSLYSLLILYRQPGFNWRKLWHGLPWPVAQRRAALTRFAVCTVGVIALTLLIAPERFFGFPLERPWLWLMVMFLYPILSVLPQELLFRSFYFTRYSEIIRTPLLMIISSGALFGFSHIFLLNWIAPVFSALGGILFAYSYSQHRSLKWVTIEHAAYGCIVFTVGLGWYFYAGAWRP